MRKDVRTCRECDLLDRGRSPGSLDITQEAFSRALERWLQVQKMSNPQGWIYRVAVRTLAENGRGFVDRQVEVEAEDNRRAFGREGGASMPRAALDRSVPEQAPRDPGRGSRTAEVSSCGTKRG